MHLMFVCPGMPFSGDFIQKGQSLGGSETACYYVAREMARMGHKVLVFTNQQDATGKHDGVDYAWCGPPSARWPLGEYVHSFMEHTYIDTMILQRAAGIHKVPHAAKVAFWWLHDIALLRAIGDVRHDSFHYDGVLTVSDWHREQVSSVWDIRKHHISVMPNAVDKTLYNSARREELRAQLGPADGRGISLLYQSRYERGIDNLIAPGAVMDQLAARRPDAKLYVCGYENEPEHMRGYYNHVRERIKQMPNVQMLGYLGKAELADLQQACDIMVYPSTFEETSCISAMEAQCAGLPLLGCAVGALPETCEGSGSKLIELPNGQFDQAAQKEFVDWIVSAGEQQLSHLREKQLAKAEEISWADSALCLEEAIKNVLAGKQQNKFSMVRSMLDRSDVLLARRYVEMIKTNPLQPELAELEEVYKFTSHTEEHYDADHAYADIERGSSLDVTQMLRFRESAQWLFTENPSNVLDYGCQKGHYLWSLAQARRDVRYTGIDISKRAIAWAREHCKIEGVHIRFESADVMSSDFDASQFGKFDGLVLGEVLEHVERPAELCNRLSGMLTPGCRVVITTPFGDWEGKDYNSAPKAARYHLHHFERADLDEMFGHNPNYMTTCVPAGRSQREPLGSWVTTFTASAEQPMALEIDWGRKLREYAPRETLSFCALAKNSETTILRSLLSVRELVDEFVIALDKTTTDGTRAVLERFRDMHAGYRRFDIIEAESPLEIGFDEARNRTVAAARGDWILWMDSDEDLIHPERLTKYLRHNCFDGYGIAQHHMSADPVGILTTDWPVRVFRNNSYLRFCGVVHEHPDDVTSPNSGPRAPAQIVDMHILHHGYTTEEVRRQRFQRNLPLIRRDRKQHPNRLLGRLLWMRDLAHMCMFELERSRGMVSPEMQDLARQGLAEWEALMKESDKPITARMVRDGLEFYSTLVGVMGVGFEAAVQMHCARGQPAKLEAGPRRQGRFLNREHFDRFLKLCVDEQTHQFDNKYF